MFYADTVGLPTVLSRVKEYRARFGDYWQPAPLLEKLVAEGRGLYEQDEKVTAYEMQPDEGHERHEEDLVFPSSLRVFVLHFLPSLFHHD